MYYSTELKACFMKKMLHLKKMKVIMLGWLAESNHNFKKINKSIS